MNRRVLAALRAAGAPAIGFVNERGLQVDGERDQRAKILAGWLEAGMTLGNHGHRHQDLSKIPLAEYQDDVVRGEVVTRALLQQRQLPLVYYRHPYTHTGPTLEVKQGFERFLAERGYKGRPSPSNTATGNLPRCTPRPPSVATARGWLHCARATWPISSACAPGSRSSPATPSAARSRRSS